MFIALAIQNLQPNASFTIENDNYDSIIWRENNRQSMPTKEEVLVEANKIKSLEPMRQLRIQRNQLLQQTDWRMTTDYPYSDQAAWASYRTELRNLPATSEPTLDENGALIVDWPTTPDSL